MNNKLTDLIKLFRLKQWIKNGFILFPLIFSGQLYDLHRLVQCWMTFIGFCLISSSMYILNDFLDAKTDRSHPEKSQRPLAQKRFSTLQVAALILGAMALGLGICLQADAMILLMGIVYIILHLIYNVSARKIVILDVIFIAAGFQIRIWAGSFAAGVLPSVWLQLCVFLLALFLGFTKRRHEISSLKTHAPEHRSVLAHYTTYLLDQIIIICSTLTIVFYGLYAISPEIIERLGNHNLLYSVGFVIYGIFRYLYLVHVKKMGGDPGELIFSDRPLMINIFLWIFYIVVLLYPTFLRI